MRKKIFFLLSAIILFLFATREVEAINCPFTATPTPSFSAPVNSITLSFDGKNIPQELNSYPSGGQLKFSFPGVFTCGRPSVSNISNPEITINNDGNPLTRCDDDLLSPGTHNVEIIYEWNGSAELICATKSYTIEEQPSSCKVEARYDGVGDVDDPSWRIAVWDINLDPKCMGVKVDLDNGKEWFEVLDPPQEFERSLPPKIRTAGTHTVAVTAISMIKRAPQMCAASFEIAPKGATPPPTPTPLPPGVTAPPQPKLEALCNQVPNNPNTDRNEHNDCIECVIKGHAYTALGCIPTDIASLLKGYLFPIGFGIAGGIAFLMILFGGFTILTSAGNPEQVAQGKELITSAIAGLLIIIFSVFILRLIGVEIFKIPGFE